MTESAEQQAVAQTDLVTQSGVKLHIRPYHSGDRAGLADFFGHVTAEDLRFHFPESGGDVSEPELAGFDRPDTLALLAQDEAGMIVACATLAREGAEAADVRVSVRADHKAQGVSWTLLEDVLRRAALMGIRTVTATESGEDRSAVNLTHQMGFVARLKSADPVTLSFSKRLDQ